MDQHFPHAYDITLPVMTEPACSVSCPVSYCSTSCVVSPCSDHPCADYNRNCAPAGEGELYRATFVITEAGPLESLCWDIVGPPGLMVVDNYSWDISATPVSDHPELSFVVYRTDRSNSISVVLTQPVAAPSYIAVRFYGGMGYEDPAGCTQASTITNIIAEHGG